MPEGSGSPDGPGDEERTLGGVEQQVGEFLLAVLRLVTAEQGDLPLGMGVVAVQAADQAGLAATVGALEGHDPIGGDDQVAVPGNGDGLLRVGDHHILHTDLVAAGPPAGGAEGEDVVRGAGGDLDQGLRLDDGGGGLIHKAIHLVDGLDELLEQQAHRDDRPGRHPAGGDESDGDRQQDHLEGDLAQLLEAVKGAH